MLGVDFTSAPRPGKPIVVARGSFSGDHFVLAAIEPLLTFEAFDALLNEPGPWTAAFDLPFGLPRELILQLNWPQTWRAMVDHVQAIGKDSFKAALNQVRESRPMGSRYIPRSGDAAAGSSSPMKLVNPPVGLMFFEGTPRLARSGVCVLPCAPNDDSRIALEAYPGYLARQFAHGSYKKDGPEGRTLNRQSNRKAILDGVCSRPMATAGLRVDVSSDLRSHCIADGSGDAIDALLCAVQAAMARRSCETGDQRYSIPARADVLEGWIATVPGS